MIEEEASEYAIKMYDDFGDDPTWPTIGGNFKAGAKFAQDKILEMASEGFEEFIEKFVRTDRYSERHMRKAYEAATIASEKKHQKENDNDIVDKLEHRIYELKKECAEMREALIDLVELINDQLHLNIYFGTYNDKHAKLIEKLKGEK